MKWSDNVYRMTDMHGYKPIKKINLRSQAYTLTNQKNLFERFYETEPEEIVLILIYGSIRRED